MDGAHHDGCRYVLTWRGLATAAVAPSLAVALLGGPIGTGFQDPGGPDDPAPSDPPPVVDAGNEGGSVTVRIEVAGSTVEGEPIVRSLQRSVAPRCWRGPGWTGMAYYEYWKIGGPAREADTLDDFAYGGGLHEGYEQYATDDEGRWWEPTCAFDTPGDIAVEYYRTHPAVYVPAGDPPPPVEVDVPPEVLAQVAFEAMDLPVGQVHWNPQLPGSGATVINTDTWVWVEEAPITLAVTASVPSGQWARVDAQLEELTVSAPGADPASCPDVGTPWTAGATGTTCSVTFFRSSANQPVKPGQSLPTATMTVTTRWGAAWVSFAGGAPTELPDQEMTTTAEIPVAEIQAIVTRG